MEISLTVVAVALVVGILVGLTGVGAGAVMTPVLVAGFAIPLPVAIATDLLFATATKIFGSFFHHKNGAIDWKLSGRLWAGSIPGTLVGVILVLFFVSRSSTGWLMWPLAAIVLLTAISLAKRALWPHSAAIHKEIHPQSRVGKTLPLAGGFGIGSAVALTSVGAGVLGMALLVRISPPNTPPQKLVGTDLVHAIPIALIAGVAYGSAGLVDWGLLANLLVGSVPGVILGSILSKNAPARILRGILAMMLFAAVLLLVFR
jgi:uncharacterized membrane protein YfcA